MARNPSKRQRKAIQFRVEKRKLAKKQQVLANINEEIPKPVKPKDALPFSITKRLRVRAVDLSPAGLRAKFHTGASSGGISKSMTKRKRFKPFSETAPDVKAESFSVKQGETILHKGRLPIIMKGDRK